MKVLVSFIALFALMSCGKKIEDRSQAGEKSEPRKTTVSASETWSIFSEKPLPARINVLINEMDFVNECTGLGNASVERTYRNGTINIVSYAAFRGEYFDVDIYDCDSGEEFFSADYVDQQIIDHPQGAPIKIVLRLRNR